MQVTGDNLSGPLALKEIRQRCRSARRDGIDGLACVTEKHSAADLRLIKRNFNQIAGRLTDVLDGDKNLEVLAATHYTGHSERHVEKRVAHQDSALRSSCDVHGPHRQTV